MEEANHPWRHRGSHAIAWLRARLHRNRNTTTDDGAAADSAPAPAPTRHGFWATLRQRPAILAGILVVAAGTAYLWPTFDQTDTLPTESTGRLQTSLHIPMYLIEKDDSHPAPTTTATTTPTPDPTPTPTVPEVADLDIAPPPAAPPVPTVVEPELPPVIRHSVTVRSGESFLGILRGHEVATTQAMAAVEKLSPPFDPVRLNVGDTLIFVLDTTAVTEAEDSDAELLELIVVPKRRNGQQVHQWQGVDYSDREVVGIVEGIAELTMPPEPTAEELVLLEGIIESTFYGTALDAGATANEIDRFLRTLRGSIDFNRQIRKGDIFEALVQRRSDGESIVRYVALESANKTLAFYRVQFADGRVGYYDREGRSYLDLLDNRPLGNTPITSGFGPRVHPVTKVHGFHRGTDFRAKHGTPVPAAGDGVVVIKGRRGSYGHYVRIRHASGFMTAYAHLQNYAKGLRVGDRVKRGEIIGYVGASGHVTGPHLHFEILQNGKHVNPLNVGAIPTPSLSGERLASFQQLVQLADDESARRRTREVASLPGTESEPASEN